MNANRMADQKLQLELPIASTARAWNSFSLVLRAGLAAVFTLAIFWGMNYLINPSDDPVIVDEPQVSISITRKPRETQTKTREQSLPKEPDQTPPPPPPPLRAPDAASTTGGMGLAFPMPAPTGVGDLSSSDRRAMPIIRIPPEYPQRELARGIEGFVLLEFTISLAGTVEDVRIINAEPVGAFENAAMRALSRWKYQPKMINGKPVAQHNMQEVFRFEITD